MTAYVIALGLATAVISFLLFQGPWQRARRRQHARRSLSPAERLLLEQVFPLAVHMPAAVRRQWERAIAIFLAEKQFRGCGGLTVSQHMRVTIAAHACLLVLGRRSGVFDGLRWILVYPDAFLVEREEMDEAGVATREEAVLAGEAWETGRIILSWADVEEGLHNPAAENVIVHEFAHQLDQEQGAFNGAPNLTASQARDEWAQVMERELDILRAQAERGGRSLLDPYGASDPVEFFAVASETFFQQPRQMRVLQPDLYRALRDCYHVDPAAWCDAANGRLKGA